ncbi:hypothetical protein LJC21_03080 [Bacteroides sp. OttesenSCG-928-E20]|nr:hypothetical protein [Bacteroides sp. OttesenSCG-928-E20]
MSKKEIYDVSAELAKEFGEVGSSEREKAVSQAWEEYNGSAKYPVVKVPSLDLQSQELRKKGLQSDFQTEAKQPNEH